MFYIVFQCKPVTEALTDIVKKWAGKRPIIFCSIGGEYTERMLRILFNKGIPVFNNIESWVFAAEALAP